MNNEEPGINIRVACPKCGARMFDKITVTTGYIEMKCPKCSRIIKVNLALRKIRKSILYRLIKAG